MSRAEEMKVTCLTYWDQGILLTTFWSVAQSLTCGSVRTSKHHCFCRSTWSCKSVFGKTNKTWSELSHSVRRDTSHLSVSLSVFLLHPEQLTCLSPKLCPTVETPGHSLHICDACMLLILMNPMEYWQTKGQFPGGHAPPAWGTRPTPGVIGWC